jgi:hypothetical protein
MMKIARSVEMRIFVGWYLPRDTWSSQLDADGGRSGLLLCGLMIIVRARLDLLLAPDLHVQHERWTTRSWKQFFNTQTNSTVPSVRQIFRVGSEKMQVNKINLMWTQDTMFLYWFGPSRGVIALRSVLMYYAIEIDPPLFLSESFGVFPRMFSGDFQDVLVVDLSSLFIVGKPSHRV